MRRRDCFSVGFGPISPSMRKIGARANPVQINVYAYRSPQMRKLFTASLLSTVLLASAAAATPMLVNGPYGPFYVADAMADAAVVAHPGVASRVIGVLDAGER